MLVANRNVPHGSCRVGCAAEVSSSRPRYDSSDIHLGCGSMAPNSENLRMCAAFFASTLPQINMEPTKGAFKEDSNLYRTHFQAPC